mgnify:CR=1 FL=1
MPQVQFRHVLLAVAACLVAGVSVQLWIEHTVARRALLERRRIPYWEFPPKFELQTQSHTRMHAGRWQHCTCVVRKNVVWCHLVPLSCNSHLHSLHH